MNRLPLTLFLLSLIWTCQAQRTEVKWAKGERLSWNDFQGNVELTSDHAAQTGPATFDWTVS